MFPVELVETKECECECELKVVKRRVRGRHGWKAEASR